MTVNQPTDHQGRRHPSEAVEVLDGFANSSERLFARLLTLYGFEWRYEPIEFPLAWNDDGQPIRGFRPDFYLPSRQLFIELTVLDQRLVTRKNRKIRDFRELYPEIDLVVVYQRDYRALLERHRIVSLSDQAA